MPVYEKRFKTDEEAHTFARDNQGVAIREDWQAPGASTDVKLFPWVVRYGDGIIPTPVPPMVDQGSAAVAFLTAQLAETMAKLGALEAKINAPAPAKSSRPKADE